MKISNQPINKEIEEALEGDSLKRMWSIILSLEGDKAFEDEKEKIRWGYDVIFDIRSIIEEDYEKKVAFDQVWVERKNQIPLTEFRDEIDKRKKEMRKILRELYDDTFDNQEEATIKGYS